MFRTCARLLPLAFALTLAACGGAPRASAPAASGAAFTTYPKFADARPHDWAGRKPTAYPIHGLDVSKFQPPIDWETARAAGVSFVFVKATEGGDRVDERLHEHWRGAGRAGVKRGAYHFFYHCRPAAEQARWFLRHMPRGSELPPVLDVEWTPDSPTCTIRRDGATNRAEIAAFVAAVKAATGQTPILYTTVDFYRDNDLDRVSGVHFWLRSVAGHPEAVHPGQHWLFWQYTGTGLVPGVQGPVDINVYAGSAESFGKM